MRRNEYLEKELEKLKNHEPIDANPDVLKAYWETKKTGNLFLTFYSFNGVATSIFPTLEKAGVEVFAVSDNSTDAMQNLFNLSKHAELVMMTAVNAPWHNIHDEDEWETIPAALFEL